MFKESSQQHMCVEKMKIIIPLVLNSFSAHSNPSKHSAVSPMILAGHAQKMDFPFRLLDAHDGVRWEVCVLGGSGLGSISF